MNHTIGTNGTPQADRLSNAAMAAKSFMLSSFIDQ